MKSLDFIQKLLYNHFCMNIPLHKMHRVICMQKKHLVWIGILTAVLLLCLSLVPLFVPTQAESLPAYAVGTASPEFSLGGFGVSAGSAVLMDAHSGSILFAQNADERRGMASTTKIMTALVVLETLSPDTVVEVSPDAVGVEGSSLYLKAGEKLTVKDLLYGLMLESGNDAAVALAIACDGSIDKFAERMNARAESLGLADTHFANPHGLSAEGHYTTARELALITAEALRNDLFCEIVSTYKRQIPYDGVPDARYLTNHNPLLTKYDGMIGVKTGWTNADGKCFVTAAVRDSLTLIAVSLGDTGISATHKSMLDYGFATFASMSLSLDAPLIVPAVGGDTSQLAVRQAEPLVVCLPKDESTTVSVETAPFVYAGTPAGTAVGRVLFSWNGIPLGSVPLVTAEEIPVKRLSFWEKIFGERENA